MHGTEARDLLTGSPESVNWHAVFANVRADGTVTWTDKQRLFPQGPHGVSVAIAISA